MREWVHPLAVVALAVCAGCTSVNNFVPGRIEARRRAIEERFGVTVDLSQASVLRGDTWRTLGRIERDLAPFPRGFTSRIPVIHVVESFVDEHGLLGLAVGAYCEDRRPALHRHVFIKNKNLLEDAVGLLMNDTGTHLVHEAWHSVEYWEVGRHRRMLTRILPEPEGPFAHLVAADLAAVMETRQPSAPGAPRTPYVRLLYGWLLAHFGDVNGDGRTDGGDAEVVAADPQRFGADESGVLTYYDLERLTPYRYRRSARLTALSLQFSLALEQLTGWTPRGFASVYGATEPHEDRAEVVALMHRCGLLALLGAPGPTRTRAARRLDHLHRRDPVLARKVDLILQYLRSLRARDA